MSSEFLGDISSSGSISMAPTDGIGASADLISKLLFSKSSRSDIISSDAWLEELDYVNDQLYAPNGSNGCMHPGY